MPGANDAVARSEATVRFDHRGALDLARALHDSANRLADAAAQRHAAGRRALAAWTGPRADEYAARLAAEIDEAEDIGRSLRAEADRWAAAWAEAINDAVPPAGVDTAIDWWTPVAVPVAPGYDATTPNGRGRP